MDAIYNIFRNLFIFVAILAIANSYIDVAMLYDGIEQPKQVKQAMVSAIGAEYDKVERTFLVSCLKSPQDAACVVARRLYP